jgi:hypothetical protein
MGLLEVKFSSSRSKTTDPWRGCTIDEYWDDVVEDESDVE